MPTKTWACHPKTVPDKTQDQIRTRPSGPERCGNRADELK